MTDARPHSPEPAAIEVGGLTRSAFLIRGALAAGALYGAGAVAPLVSRALAQTSAGDQQILSFLVALEEVESAFYKAALKGAGLSGAPKALATEFGKHEDAHMTALKNALSLLGGQPPAPPSLKFNVSGRNAFFTTGAMLEDAGVGAYNGAITRLRSPDLVAAAGAIVQVEARHAAALRFRGGKDATPAAFDTPLAAGNAQAAVRRAAGG